MSSVNWWISSSFCGSFSRLVSSFSQSVVALTSRALTRPMTWPGTSLGPIRHSGSSARLTSGSLSHLRSRLVSVKKSLRPGWMSRISSALALRAAFR